MVLIAQRRPDTALSEDDVKNLKTEVAHGKLRVAQALREWCDSSRISPRDLLNELEIGPAGKHIFSATSICRNPDDLYARLCLRTKLAELDPRTIPPMLQRVHGGYEAVPRAWDDSRFNIWLQERGTTLEQLEKQLQTYETSSTREAPHANNTVPPPLDHRDIGRIDEQGRLSIVRRGAGL